jgi:F0F1-type ATP synthase epsilon subunit
MEINITEELKEKLKKKAKEGGFDSIQDYTLFILNEAVSSTSEIDEDYTEEEEEALRKRLEDSGYL